MTVLRAALFGGRRSVPFAFYRSGTSRGLFVLEQDVPPKAVIVGRHSDRDTVTYSFLQCSVKEKLVDHSHGDCGNMIAAVAPFALERGLVDMPSEESVMKKHVRIHSLSTGSVYGSDILLKCSEGGKAVCYDGDIGIPGVPSLGAPIIMTTFGVAGSQTGKLLPTNSATDRFDLGSGLGKVAATVVDFGRALIMLDAGEVLPKFGYNCFPEATKERIEADTALNMALDRVRQDASLRIGMGDCSGKDAPKVALLAPHAAGADLACIYFVNPERCEMHPSIAMTASQAIGAGCLLEGSVARSVLGRVPIPHSLDDNATFTFTIAHPQGFMHVTIGTAIPDQEPHWCTLFPKGVPTTGKYTTTVHPIAEGRAFL
eukprot:TRINITY_DN23614_c0_g1_i2.p1 TRINITY_DN23614_c0_g1~~TRINITY_DN23614_c0_g1_i2.p1  ORF type:complete len:372 (+),score=58.58 TRINITY_DN23614_c0_g1_i2:58-1173(+)